MPEIGLKQGMEEHTEVKMETAITPLPVRLRNGSILGIPAADEGAIQVIVIKVYSDSSITCTSPFGKII